MANSGNILRNLRVQDRIMKKATAQEICRILWSRVKFLPNGCWIRMPLEKGSNPRVWLYDRKVGAHRLALFARDRSIPRGRYCLHSCNYGLCVRPSHLYWGTPAQNSRDRINHAIAKGNQAVLSTSLAGKYSDEEVREIWFMYFHNGWNVASIAREMGCSGGYVVNLLTRIRRHHATKDLVGDYKNECLKRKQNMTNRSSSRVPDHQSSSYLRDHQVVEVREMLNEGQHPADVAFALGLPYATVKNIRANVSYKHVPGSVKHFPFEPRYTKKRGRPCSVNSKNPARKYPANRKPAAVVSAQAFNDESASCRISDFDELITGIWKKYHTEGLPITTIAAAHRRPKRFVSDVVKGRVRYVVLKNLGWRGQPGMYGQRKILPGDAVDIFKKHQTGMSHTAIAKEYNTHRGAIANVVNRVTFAEQTANLKIVPREMRPRIRPSGLSADDVRSIRNRFAGGESAKSLGLEFGVVSRCIYHIKNRQTYKWVQ